MRGECRGAQKVEPREGNGREERGGWGGGARQEGPAASQPTSTSGLVKVSTAGPPVPLVLLSPSPRPVSFFLFPSCIRFSLRLSFSRHSSIPFFSPSASSLLPRRCSYRIIASYRARTHALSPVCRRINVSFLFSQTVLRSCEIPISGDTRVIGRQRIA